MPDGVGWLLAFDLGRRTGFAAAGPSFRPRSALEIGAGQRVVDYVSGAMQLADGDEHYRGRILKSALDIFRETIRAYRPRLVFYEAILLHKRGDDRGRMLAGLAAVLEVAAYELGVPIRDAFNQSWRKHFDGKAGKTDKARTIASCLTRGYGDFGSDDDRADATGILDFCATIVLNRQAQDAARERRIAADEAWRAARGQPGRRTV
jgi:hypothetical protein